MGEMDTEAQDYLVVAIGLELIAFGPSVDEKTFLKHATDLQEKALKNAKHTAHYRNENSGIMFYKNLITGKYDFISDRSEKILYGGSLNDIIPFMEKCKERLDAEKRVYNKAIKRLKYSEKK